MRLASLILLVMVLSSVILGLFGCSHTAPWTHTEYVLAGSAVALTAMDYLQTNTISRYPDAYERNPLLPRRPSDVDLAIYFPVSTVVAVLIADLLDPPWRSAWLGAWVAMEAVVVIENQQMGLRP